VSSPYLLMKLIERFNVYRGLVKASPSIITRTVYLTFTGQGTGYVETRPSYDGKVLNAKSVFEFDSLEDGIQQMNAYIIAQEMINSGKEDDHAGKDKGVCNQ
jgi:hypothetical protein